MFNTFIYEPLANILVWSYQNITFGNLALAIILLTVIVRTLLYPLYHKTLHHQAAMARLKPEMDAIRKEYATDKEEQSKKILELYKKNDIKPFGMFLMVLLQLPILYALFKVFTTGLKTNFANILYPFITLPVTINYNFLGLIDLSGRSILLITIAAIAQYFQVRMSMQSATLPVNDDLTEEQLVSLQKMQSSITSVMLTGFTVIILWNLPAAIAVYWITNTVISVVQQKICERQIRNAEYKTGNQSDNSLNRI
jgi:YidC/Oxa1 family membrane protein insertase